MADVEVIDNDHPPLGSISCRAADLPVVGRLGVLLVLGGDPAVEGKQERGAEEPSRFDDGSQWR